MLTLPVAKYKMGDVPDSASQICVAGSVDGITQPTKACDSNPTSTAPSPSSAESTSDGPSTAKRRRNKSPSPPMAPELCTIPVPPPSTPHTLQVFPPARMSVLAPHHRLPNSFNFMTQHLLALQYQQNLKMSTMQPGILPPMTPVYPFAAVTTIPWRGM
ncbi:unnamed protein product [Angiostrongylus costaricensis]|uniref:PAM2 domain-containing protein n=1 Tax=Angiostrongylus costaricensis TaxID=334426 RepID=A0A0R3PSV1_ANGCS|nr:unnamed protein product [Angiostrongylus costaricensis]